MNPLLANSTVRKASDVNNADSSPAFTFAQPVPPNKVRCLGAPVPVKCTLHHSHHVLHAHLARIAEAELCSPLVLLLYWCGRQAWPVCAQPTHAVLTHSVVNDAPQCPTGERRAHQTRQGAAGEGIQSVGLDAAQQN